VFGGVEKSGASGERGNSDVAEQNGGEQCHSRHRRVGISIPPAFPRSHDSEDQRTSELRGENDGAKNEEYCDYKLVFMILKKKKHA